MNIVCACSSLHLQYMVTAETLSDAAYFPLYGMFATIDRLQNRMYPKLRKGYVATHTSGK